MGKYWFLTSLWLVIHPSDSLSNQLRDRYLETFCLTKHIWLLRDELHHRNSYFSHWLQHEFSVMNLAGDIYTGDLCIWSDKSTYSVHSPMERELSSLLSVLKNALSKCSFHVDMLPTNRMGKRVNLWAIYTIFMHVTFEEICPFLHISNRFI